MLGSTSPKHSNGNPSDYNTGVIAATDIPENCIAGPHPGEFKLGQNSLDEPNIDYIIEVKHKDGRITLDFESSNQWIKYVQPARDRHEQNIEFYKDRTGTVYLRTTRKLKMGEQLYAWFSEPLARESGVPFLSLQNIIGNQQYQCDKCQLSYRYPNPLKAHMMFRCKAQEVEIQPLNPYGHQWNPFLTLGCSSSRSCLPNADYTQYFRNIQNHTTGYLKEDKCFTNAWMKHLSSKSSHSRLDQRCMSQHSECFEHNARLSPPKPITFSTTQSHFFPFQHCTNLYYNLIPTSPVSNGADHDPEAGCKNKDVKRNSVVPLPSEMEGEPLDILPKSLLTKCKSGHICIFCGKFYSRKYGLKIHLRTHTGYKPLKCKVCLRPFGDPSNLNKHVRLHAEGDTPYRCEFCNKVLVRRRDLERHIRSRHPKETSASVLDSDSIKDNSDNEEIIVA
ncbi:uncharacterized protein LOC143048003 [Mytilus galloprovincialis]|uniref:uncharacterized protein LOC143048003 n=1 Tax=Mytilus galloprovincialis TaxID=29158 RepID=UPI003F7B44C4